MHSVNKSRVTEIFEVRNGQIVLNAVEFETFGAGMATELEPGQTMTRLEGGVMRIDGFNRTIYDMQVLVGQNTDHTLHIGDLDIRFETGQIILKIKRN
jgi:hypothetical protein